MLCLRESERPILEIDHLTFNSSRTSKKSLSRDYYKNMKHKKKQLWLSKKGKIFHTQR